MRKKLSTEVKSEKDFKKIYHPSHNFLVNYMETKQTYWLFGSYESCKIYREYRYDKKKEILVNTNSIEIIS